MRAMRLLEFGGSFEPVDVDVPRPGQGEVLVRVEACGAGLTLEHGRLGLLGGSTPRILGHEFAGRVEALGEGAGRWTVGTAVTANFYLLCGACDMCANGRETLCRNDGGYFGLAVDGAFAEYVVAPERSLVEIPDGVVLHEAGVVADAVATPYHVASQQAHVQPGQTVAVIGAGGGVGVHMTQVARAFGATAIGVERDAAKLERLEGLDLADVLVAASTPWWGEELSRAARGRLDACVDMVASTEAFPQGVRALGVGGTFVIVGFQPRVRLDLEPTRLLLEELVVTGNRYTTRSEIGMALELVRAGHVRPVIGAVFELERLNDAFEAIRGSTAFGRVLIDCRATPADHGDDRTLACAPS
ncbi:alcohol dehydrogenase AdhP [soil metagenome]